MRQRERVFVLQQVQVQLRFAQERAHEAQHPDGGIQRIQQRVLDMLPVMDGRVSESGDLVRIKGLHIRFQRASVHRNGAAGNGVQGSCIAGKETFEFRLVEGRPFNAHAGIQRRTEVIVPPPQVEPHDEPHGHAGRPGEPAEESPLSDGRSDQHDQEGDGESQDDNLLQRDRTDGCDPGQDCRDDRVAALRVEIRHRHRIAASDDESEQRQSHEIGFPHVHQVLDTRIYLFFRFGAREFVPIYGKKSVFLHGHACNAYQI